jgi:transaldolase
MTADRLGALSAAGVSIWLDDLSRGRLDDGSLGGLIDTHHIVGVTTNPSIFDAAISNNAESYAGQLRELAATAVGTDAAIREMTTDDVRRACDVLRDVWRDSDGIDGRVSIEVDPRLAHDTDATVSQAKSLWADVDRPNLLIKIPATLAGLPAITEVLGSGISVNVTLIFSVDRYRDVMVAWLDGLERASAAGHDLATIHSVASFFVSRVDTEVDKRLDAMGDASMLRGTAAIANARVAYHAFLDVMASSRWKTLESLGARRQRPLWASTGVKDPSYDDTRYVVELVAANTVNTMPEKTLDAVKDHGVIIGDTISPNLAAASESLAALAAAGIDIDDVYAVLESEGVSKFVDAWQSLRTTVAEALSRS